MVERLRVQMAEMEEWKAREQRLLRRVFQYLALGLLFFMLAVGVAFWEISGLVNKNRQLITKVEHVASTQAQANYEDCLARNTQSNQSSKALQQFVRANTLDGNPETAKVWKEYLDQLKARKLPVCEKPPTPDHRNQ